MNWEEVMELAKIIPRLCHNINRYSPRCFRWPCEQHVSVLFQLGNVVVNVSPFRSRVVWVFGSVVRGPIEEVTPTYLRPEALATLRQADFLATSVLTKHSTL